MEIGLTFWIGQRGIIIQSLSHHLCLVFLEMETFCQHQLSDSCISGCVAICRSSYYALPWQEENLMQ